MLDRFERQGIPCGAVNDVGAALADPQAEARGSLVSYAHPAFGTVRTTRSPFRISTGDELPARRGPFLGEHSADVLREVCGYEDKQICALEEAGVIGTGTTEEVR